MNTPCKYIPNSQSRAENWIAWHKALKKWFSKAEANEHWLRFWWQRAGAGTTADTHSLRSYMESQGVDLTTDFSGELTDSIEGVKGWFSDTFKLIRNLFLGAVIIAVALISYYVIMSARKGKSVAEMALDVRSLGASSKLKALR